MKIKFIIGVAAENEKIRQSEPPDLSVRVHSIYLMQPVSYTHLIDDTVAYNKADSPELARKGGEGIGKFQAQLADFTEPLAETIKGFHNIRHRFVQRGV